MAGRFHGSIPALVTPFADGAVDYAALERLLEWHIEAGTHGFVAVGTTGESPTLSHAEHEEVVSFVVRAVGGRRPVIAGAGSNNTAESISLIRHAEKVGADAALVVAPYYNKPNQAGLLRHYTAIHDAAGLPIILYNVPGRTVSDIKVETAVALSKLPRIIGIKDASQDLSRPALTRLGAGPDFIQLSGEDPSALAFNADGGVGCISVTANVAPKLCAELQDATLRGDFAAARAAQDKLAPLHAALFVEPSPAPAKFGLSLLGMARNELRSPLGPVAADTEDQVRAAMTHAGLL